MWNSGVEVQAPAAIHPAVVRLGLKYNNYSIMGSDARAAGLLTAFDQVGVILVF